MADGHIGHLAAFDLGPNLQAALDHDVHAVGDAAMAAHVVAVVVLHLSHHGAQNSQLRIGEPTTVQV